ncbi:hypothetical protein WN944_013380 [Citrus x changshan-huyou]|uniref:Uncharacterized protein n=1 Tax=Citrus x changshan-huyou TaxID=2935761 RepID=A0AAP0M3R3_9ROSI
MALVNYELGHNGGDHKRRNGYPFLSNGYNQRGEARSDDTPCINNGEVSKCDDGVFSCLASEEEIQVYTHYMGLRREGSEHFA